LLSALACTASPVTTQTLAVRATAGEVRLQVLYMVLFPLALGFAVQVAPDQRCVWAIRVPRV